MFDILNYVKIFTDNVNRINIALFSTNNNDTPVLLVNDNANYKNIYDFPTVKNMHVGDCIVMFPGDLVITWKSEKRLLTRLLSDILECLKSYDMDVYMNGNDVMMNGCKLFGTMSTELSGIRYEGMFISFNSDINIIQDVCKKQMNKRPLGISDKRIRADLIKIIEQFCKDKNLEICGGEQ